MSRKFARVPEFRVALACITITGTILAGAGMAYAQQTPEPSSSNSQQQPATRQSSSQQTSPPPTNTPQTSTSQTSNQEASTEEVGPVRKPKVKDYKNWAFNVGGGASLTNGATGNFVRGGGGIAAAGIARNTSKYFGLRFDFQFDNLPLRTSALEQAQARSATSHVYSFNLDPIINIPVTPLWSGYIVAGGSFFHRSGKLDSSTAIPGSACNAFFTWWGNCFDSSLPLNRNFISTSQNEWGENFGAGIARKIRPNVEIYGEFRYLHGTHSGVSTDLRPITVGVRW
jgi:Outer membrane protein beta-barrel domain